MHPDKIQGLVDQAKKNVPPGLNPEEWLKVYHNKFAELIIKECADIISRSVANYDDRALFNPREIADRAVLSVNKHFGVKS